MASRGRLLNVLRAAIMCLCWRRRGKEVDAIQSTREKRIMYLAWFSHQSA